MTSVCIDASFIARLLLEPASTSYRALWNQWETNQNTLVAPVLMRYELTNVFHRAEIAGSITPEAAIEALETILSFRITLYNDAELHRHALRLAQQYNLVAAYDAHYLALSERLNAPFYTSDRRLWNSVHTSLTWVNLVA